MTNVTEIVASAEIANLKADNKKLRYLLWIRHNSGHMLYGDDGCMDCNTCGMDFKNMSVNDIEMVFWKQAMLELQKPEVREKINALMFTLDKTPLTFKESTSGKEVK